DPDMAGAKLDRDLEVAAHTHRKTGKTVSPRDVLEQRKVKRRLFSERRNAHQALDLELPLTVAAREKRIGISRSKPCFLALFPRVHLNEKSRQLSSLASRLHKRLGKLRPVDSVKHIEELKRIFELVCLQWPDQVKFDVRILFA